MAQIPTTDNSYARLSVLKAKGVIAKGGVPTTWDDVISAICDVCDNHNDEFIEFIQKKRGKIRNVTKPEG